MSDEETPAPPVLRVITASATPEEIAAVTAVLGAMSIGDREPARPVREWAAPRRTHRAPLPTGRGAWRASALPR